MDVSVMNLQETWDSIERIDKSFVKLNVHNLTPYPFKRLKLSENTHICKNLTVNGSLPV